MRTHCTQETPTLELYTTLPSLSYRTTLSHRTPFHPLAHSRTRSLALLSLLSLLTFHLPSSLFPLPSSLFPLSVRRAAPPALSLPPLPRSSLHSPAFDEALQGCDVVVIPAGVPRKPGMTRQDLFEVNASLNRDFANAVAKNCPKAFVAIISNPVNSTVPIFAEQVRRRCEDEKRERETERQRDRERDRERQGESGRDRERQRDPL